MKSVNTPERTLHVGSFTDSQRSETEDMNEVEKPQVPLPPRTTSRPAPKTPRKPVSKPSATRPAVPRTSPAKTPSNPYLGNHRNTQN